MASFSTIAAIISAAGTLFSSLGQLGVFGGDERQALPAPFAPAPGPQAPEVQPDLTKFDRPGALAQAPAYLQLSSGMTPFQQRTALATGAVSGESGAFRDEAAQDFYQNLVLSTLVGQGGAAIPGAKIAQVEKRFVEEVLGETIREPTTASFLSALMRGTS